MLSVSIRKGKAYVPVVARTEAGYHLEIEPVAVLDSTDEEGLASVLANRVERGTPVVLTPTRQNFPTPVVMLHAGVRSWNTFEKKSAGWTIIEKNDGYEIHMTGRDTGGRWTDDLSPTYVPYERGIEEVARVIVAQAKARSDL